MAKLFILACLAAVLSAACVTMDGERASRLEAMERELLGLPAVDPRFKVTAIGTADYQDHEFPMLAVEFRPPGGAAYSVLNTGGVHGDEAGGVETIYRMIRECKNAERGRIARDFILCMNPWGYRFDKRENHDRIDLNRDFRAFESQEARIVDAYLRNRKYDLVIDHHENKNANGFSIICHDEERRPLVRAIIDGLPQYGVATKMQKVVNLDVGITIMGLGDGKALSQYAGTHLCGGKGSFVIETPTGWDREKRIRCQLELAKRLEETMLGVVD